MKRCVSIGHVSPARARELVDRALAINPDYVDALFLRYDLARARGLSTLAAGWLEEMAADPASRRHARLWRKVSLQRLEDGDTTAALLALERAHLGTQQLHVAAAELMVVVVADTLHELR